MRVQLGVLATALLVTTAACGKIPAVSEDGGPDDAGPPDAPAVGEATLVVLHEDDSPVVGATVIFALADGTQPRTVITNAQGEATQVVTGGDWAWVSFNEGSGASGMTARLFTIVGIEPGDLVRVGGQRRPTPNNLGSMTVSWPLAGRPPEATRVRVSIGCQSQEPPLAANMVTFSVASDCVTSQGKMSTLVMAYNAADKPVGYTQLLDHSFQANVSLGAWNSNFGPTAITVAGVDPSALQLKVETSALRGGNGYGLDELTGLTANPSTVFDVRTPPSISEQYEYTAFMAFMGTVELDGFLVIATRVLGAPPATATADFGEGLPRLHAATINTGEPIRVQWTTTGSTEQVAHLAAADVGVFNVSWTTASGGTNLNHEWLVMLPGSKLVSPFTLAVPAELRGAAPGADAMGPVGFGVMAFELSNIDGYEGAKNVLGTQLLENGPQGNAFEAFATVSGQGF